MSVGFQLALLPPTTPVADITVVGVLVGVALTSTPTATPDVVGGPGA